MDIFSRILYKDSPFQPEISETAKNRVITDIIVNWLSPIVAIAKEVALTGTELNEIHEAEFEWMVETFKVTAQDLENFMLGFTTPPSLIIGGFTGVKYGFPKAIKVICPATEDKLMIQNNTYLSFHLLDAINIVDSSLHRAPIVGAALIYDLCRKNPYSLDFYYHAGIEAGKRIFFDLSNSLFPPPTNPA